MSTNTMTIVAVTTSLSEDSTTLKLTDRILESATSAGESVGIAVNTEVINVRTLATALTDMTLTGFRSEALEAAFATVAEADAIVSVAPVYKVAPVGLHTLFWQLIDEKVLTRTPVLIASTGGTPRHSLAGESVLRPMLSYLKGIVVPSTVFAATDDWGSIEGGRALGARIRQAGEELVSLTSTIIGAGNDDLAEVADPESADARFASGQGKAATAGAGSRGIDDEFDPDRITPFAQLLEG
ncbi:NAD(P)H-dependent oxidoreductase [Brevibacterium atlanticum]|uniref:NAD(P)H-dependent oxidoreductase n=1 Tax=Brevibacterium atlanticum TaxID=2697563 RepID=UPI001D187FF2|nr:NAD(P)H-dependent oxidoreductase [Brevibacterium atlanticum]